MKKRTQRAVYLCSYQIGEATLLLPNTLNKKEHRNTYIKLYLVVLSVAVLCEHGLVLGQASVQQHNAVHSAL